MQQDKTASTDGDSQFKLLSEQRFLPFFLTQFFGAFNDNLFKNALLLLIAFEAADQLSMSGDVLNNLAAALFIAPFFLFSALAGQLADRVEKASMVRTLKVTEMLIMGLAAFMFLQQSTYGLLLVLFLMGTQSAFFGPVKYAIIPQHLREDELIGGNALVEMGTFMAILLGTALAGVIMQLDATEVWISLSICTVAVLGWLSSRGIPLAEAQGPVQPMNWNLLSATGRILGYAKEDRVVFLSILGISWFWFLGASYLTQLPLFTKEVLLADKAVVTWLLCAFSVGIGLGSLLCERLSGRHVEIGIVPLGALGLSIFGIDLYFAAGAISGFSDDLVAVEALRTAGQFFDESGSWRILADMTLLGLFGGLYIVPLYALVQKRTPADRRAQVIAANNVLNALFMVLAAIAAAVLLGVADLSKDQFFLAIALVNILVAAFIFNRVPAFVGRFIIWLLTHTLYSVKHRDLQHIPGKGAAVLVCNHVSFVDALLLAAVIRRPIRFVMYKPIYDLPVLNFVFRTGKTIPITSKEENAEVYEAAFNRIARVLEKGHVVCIFPEGALTRTGEIAAFKKGIEKIIARSSVPVVPLALRGLWGSAFSHHGSGALKGWSWRRLRSKIEVVGSESVAPEDVAVGTLYERVKALRGDVA